jgi:hypothetical protein
MKTGHVPGFSKKGWQISLGDYGTTLADKSINKIYNRPAIPSQMNGI